MMRQAMWDQLAGGWKQFRGEIRKQWGKLTDDDLEYIAGKREKLIGRIQERYGMAEADAANQVDHWAANVKL